jgi:hypothetical protein
MCLLLFSKYLLIISVVCICNGGNIVLMTQELSIPLVLLTLASFCLLFVGAEGYGCT